VIVNFRSHLVSPGPRFFCEQGPWCDLVLMIGGQCLDTVEGQGSIRYRPIVLVQPVQTWQCFPGNQNQGEWQFQHDGIRKGTDGSFYYLQLGVVTNEESSTWRFKDFGLARAMDN